MPYSNEEIAKILHDFADKLEASGDNPYRIRAYRRAARSVSRTDIEISTLLQKEDALTDIPYVGSKISAIIKNIILNNRLPTLTQRKEKQIVQLKSLQKKRAAAAKIRIFRMMPILENFIKELKTIKEVQAVEAVGDFRRRQELISEVRLLIAKNKKADFLKHILAFDNVAEITTQDPEHVIVKLYAGVNIHLTFTSLEKFATDLIYYTGSTAHFQKLQSLAKKKKYNLSPEGLYKNDKIIACDSEHDIYKRLGLPFIEPELREDRGEIEAGRKLPKLITIEDIKGDLHSHTNETDGVETLETMVKTAQAKNYLYLAITDHSKRLAITNGMDEKRLLKQIKLIDKLNEKLDGRFIILKSIEVDILANGDLDLSNDVLKELDLRVCSVHSLFKLPKDKQTERIIRAMDNPYFNILGHATGRLIISRAPYELDIEKIFQAAKERNCVIELNGQPYRLDVNDVYCKMGKELGLKFAISSDAHSVRELNNHMRYGVDQARRGWLEKGDVVNTRNVGELLKILKRN